MSYMTVETTNLAGCTCFSFQNDEHDIPNGAVVGRGDLIKGETEIYQAVDLTESNYKNGLFLVANPAWNYDDSSATAQNEENYINVKGKPFRVYELLPHRKFKIGNIDAEQGFDQDKFVKFELSTGKYKQDAEVKAGLKVINIEETGFPYCIGSAGSKIQNDSGNKYGSGVLDMRNTKYTIEYVPTQVAGK